MNNDNEIKILYEDKTRDVLVGYGRCPESSLIKYRHQFDRIVESYENREKGWMEWATEWLESKKDRLSFVDYFDDVKKGNEPRSIIRQSFELLESIGVVMEHADVKIRYATMDVGEDFEYDYDRQHYYRFDKEEDKEDENKNIYGCIFCVRKDSGVNDGNIVIYPNFVDVYNTCFTSHKEMDLPFDMGSVIVLNGSTVHNIPKITGKGVMRVIYVIFRGKLL